MGTKTQISEVIYPKRLGLLGGLSFRSVTDYGTGIAESIQVKTGNQAGVDVAMRCFNAVEIQALVKRHDWEGLGQLVTDAALGLTRDHPIEALVITSNTVHRVAAQLSSNEALPPLLHVGDALVNKVAQYGFRRVGFIGLSHIAEDKAVIGRLEAAGVEVCLTPRRKQQEYLDNIILDEVIRFCDSRVSNASYNALQEIMRNIYDERRVQAFIIGCTEFSNTMIAKLHHDFCIYWNLRDDLCPFISSKAAHIDQIVDFCCR